MYLHQAAKPVGGNINTERRRQARNLSKRLIPSLRQANRRSVFKGLEADVAVPEGQ